MLEMTDYQKEQAEESRKIQELGKEVAKWLPSGWNLLPPREGYDYDRMHARIGKDGMVLNMSFGTHRESSRINIQSFEWPSYLSAERTVYDTSLGEVRAKEVINPSCLYDPKESYPAITVDRGKTPEQIAKDITRRFLPDYERIYARCKEKADLYQKQAYETLDSWGKFCKIAKQNPQHGVAYATIAGIEGHATLKRSGNTAKLEMYVTPDQLEKIIKALEVQPTCTCGEGNQEGLGHCDGCPRKGV